MTQVKTQEMTHAKTHEMTQEAGGGDNNSDFSPSGVWGSLQLFSPVFYLAEYAQIHNSERSARNLRSRMDV